MNKNMLKVFSQRGLLVRKTPRLLTETAFTNLWMLCTCHIQRLYTSVPVWVERCSSAVKCIPSFIQIYGQTVTLCEKKKKKNPVQFGQSLLNTVQNNAWWRTEWGDGDTWCPSHINNKYTKLSRLGSKPNQKIGISGAPYINHGRHVARAEHPSQIKKIPKLSLLPYTWTFKQTSLKNISESSFENLFFYYFYK